MSCSITLTGRGTNCRNSLGGIKNVYMAQWSDGLWNTASAGATAGPVASTDFYTFNLLRNSGSFNTAVTASTENGTVFFEETLVTVFGGAKEATPGDNNGFTLTFMAEELLPPQILTNGASATNVAYQNAPA